MVQIDIQMPSDCYSCWVRKNMGCKIANDSGWLNNKRDDNCPLKEQEAVEPFHKCIDKDFTLIEDSHFYYCPYCGKPITWAKQEENRKVGERRINMDSITTVNDTQRVNNNMIFFTDSELAMIMRYMEVSGTTTVQDAIITAIRLAIEGL